MNITPTKMYYVAENAALSENNRIIPTPFMNINREIIYASDTNSIVIGYKYIINLSGTITAYRKTDNDETTSIDIRGLSDQIAFLRNQLAKMGGFLYVQDNNANNIIVCKGGRLVSFDINNSDNNWRSTAPFTATIEFQEVEFLGIDIGCENNSLRSQSLSNNIVDINKYKLINFSDNWSINLEESIYDRIRNIDSDQDVGIENMSFRISYTINATGKHFFIDNKLIPAWEQAKNFCQDRLYTQVKNLVGQVLEISTDNTCNSIKTLNNMSPIPAASGSGLFNGLSSDYGVFNETVSCSTSESAGTFSATYNAIIKRVKSSTFTTGYAKHTFTKKIDHQKQDTKITKISIEGNIEGLIQGGLIYMNTGSFNLPQNGNLIVQGAASSNAKYTNAYNELLLIFNPSLTDFKDTWKNSLNITYDSMISSIAYTDCEENTGYPLPASINLTHDYYRGTINYSLEYSSDKSCITDFASVSISVDKPTTMYATFTIPKGVNTPEQIGNIFQNLGTKTSRIINITIKGRDNSQKLCCNNPSTILSSANLCGTIQMPQSIQNKLPDENIYILKQKSQDVNMVDGSYTLNLSYICPPGCDI